MLERLSEEVVSPIQDPPSAGCDEGVFEKDAERGDDDEEVSRRRKLGNTLVMVAEAFRSSGRTRSERLGSAQSASVEVPEVFVSPASQSRSDGGHDSETRPLVSSEEIVDEARKEAEITKAALYVEDALAGRWVEVEQ